MSKITKALCLAAVLLLVVALMTGCSKRNSSVTGPKPETVKQDALSELEGKMKGLSSYETTMDMDGRAITILVKLSNGKPVRMKMNMGQAGKWMFIMLDKKENYMYDEAMKIAMKMPTGQEGVNTKKVEALSIEDLKAKRPVIKSDNLDGMKCWLIEMPDTGNGVVQSWVDKKYGLPRQEKVGEKLIKHTYKQINSVPDSEFELPAGTKISEISDMMKGMPQGMPKPPAMPGQ